MPETTSFAAAPAERDGQGVAPSVPGAAAGKACGLRDAGFTGPRVAVLSMRKAGTARLPDLFLNWSTPSCRLA